MLSQPKAILAALFIFTGASTAAQADVPKVVVSIKPLHSIVSAVMGDLGKPTLLVKGATTPHAYSLKPSDAKAINDADVIVWVGEGLETFLTKPLLSLSKKPSIVTMTQNDRIYTLEIRDKNGEVHEDEHAHKHESSIDPHIWMDPRNMSELARTVGQVLGDVDPDNARKYKENAQVLIFKTEKVSKKFEFGLYAERGRPFFVFHDAYQYLERGFGLNVAGFLAVDPNRRPSVKRLHEARALIEKSQSVCVMSEPQFDSKLMKTLVEGMDINMGQLDAIGADLTPGPEMYIQMMEMNLVSLKKCLTWKK
ncbi:MAG: zinc ABC transporter substrate-binding protein [Rhodospirillales bacterium]|nr:zinc ABC transporter substrate-binding protein [Rhodospirillales bacterium]